MLRPRKPAITVEDNIAMLNRIISQINELMLLTDNDKVKGILNDYLDKVQYSNPTDDDSINHIDTKISNTLGDLKIQIVTNQPMQHINYKLDTIKILIIERLSRA